VSKKGNDGKSKKIVKNKAKNEEVKGKGITPVPHKAFIDTFWL